MTTHPASIDPKGAHVLPLLTRYVSGQLDRAQTMQVQQHIRCCADCRQALHRERLLSEELTRYLPKIGQPTTSQLRLLWPKIRAEAFGAPVRGFALANQTAQRWSSVGVIGGALLITVFALSSLFGLPIYANAAPNQPKQSVPSDIMATNTPVRTDAPGALSTLAALITPPPSRTAASAGRADNANSTPDSPMAAPAPITVRWSPTDRSGPQ